MAEAVKHTLLLPRFPIVGSDSARASIRPGPPRDGPLRALAAESKRVGALGSTLPDQAGFGPNDSVAWYQSENVVNYFHPEVTTT